MTHDDVLFGFRLRLFTLAEELGNVSEACRQMGVSRSTYYELKPKLCRYGLDGLRVCERRRPRMPNQSGYIAYSRSPAASTTRGGGLALYCGV